MEPSRNHDSRDTKQLIPLIFHRNQINVSLLLISALTSVICLQGLNQFFYTDAAGLIIAYFIRNSGKLLVSILYSTRIKELGNWREAISVKQLGFKIKSFTTKCTYKCTMLFKVLEPFQQIHFFFHPKIFFSVLG